MDLASLVAELERAQADATQHAPTPSSFRQQQDDDDLGGVVNKLSSLQMGYSGDTAFAPVSMRLFQQGVVQLLHLSQANQMEKNTRRWFLQNWTKGAKPFVRDIFLVLPNSPQAQQHEADFKAFEANVRNAMNATDSTQYITHAYHGTKRNCNIGADGGETNPCNNDCFVCSILKGSFRMPKPGSWGYFGAGIYTSTESSKANGYGYNVNSSDPIKAIFLCSVITGRKHRLTTPDSTLSSAGYGYESVESEATGSNETIVYNAKQIKPHAVIMYSLSPTNVGPRPSPKLVHHDVYTIANNLFPKGLDLNVNDHRVVGFRMHGKDNQLWILESEGGGWLLRNKQRPDLYLGLKHPNNFHNAADIAGVDYNSRVVWELQLAEGNTYRIAIHSNNHWNLDLNKLQGNNDGASVVLWSHAVGADQQRWNFDYVEHWNGQNGAPSTNPDQSSTSPNYSQPSGTHVQTPVNHGVYTLVNNRFRSVIDFSLRNGQVFGYKNLGNDNQHWIFEQESGGWIIRNKADPSKYLGVSGNSRYDGTNLVPVDHSSRIVWQVKPAMNNCIRINPTSDYSQEIDLSTRGGSNPLTQIVLYHHIVNQTNQRWELVSTGQLFDAGSGSSSQSSSGTYNPSGKGTQVQQPVNNGVYTIFNTQFRTVLDLAKSGGRVFGFKSWNGENQKWIFERSGSGWKIRNNEDRTQYLGLAHGSHKDGTKLVPVHQSSGNVVVWEIKTAMDNTVRINAVGSWSQEWDLSTWGGAADRTDVVLYHHIMNADNQRWELMFHGTTS